MYALAARAAREKTKSASANLIVVGLFVALGLAAYAARQRAVASSVAAEEYCTGWDRAASGVVAAMPAVSRIDRQRRQDATFRLLRARRNCAAGWVELACDDYRTLRSGPLPLGDGKWHRLDRSKSCTLAPANRLVAQR